ncbi:TolC family protein [Variovorax sp. MHTC-1]|uniref:TolC family protein n=1 Tax=Variovorax sp. MHTC-1 TaxID=2495593 RepID=UPI000F86801C|nr:TolC family protein [Variovorax sp. MHTC-1]RST50986.1 TolC family protein [Variovorax sp. MHTC-1]
MFIVSFLAAPRGRRARLSLAATALCLALATLSAHAEPALTLERAVELAQQRSRQLTAQDAAASASREMAVAAGQLPDPTLKAGIDNLPVNGADRLSLTRDFMTMRSIGVMQELTRADKRQARSARFEREAEAAEAGRAAALASLQRDTAAAWLERHYRERVRAILVAQRDEAGLQIEAADAAYRGGRGSQADAFAARMAVARIDDTIRQADRQIATAKTKLARWLGDDAHQALGAPPELSDLPLDERNLDARIANHPQIAMLARQEEVARAEAEVARSNKRSDWSVELMYSQRGSAYSNMVSLNVSIPLQVDPAKRQDRELAAKLALADQAHDQREEALRERLAEARSWLQEWQSNRDRLAHYDNTLIPLASERTRAAMAAYRGGGLLGSVLEARRVEIDTRMERVRLEMETAGLWAQLNYLIPIERRSALQDRASEATEK